MSETVRAKTRWAKAGCRHAAAKAPTLAALAAATLVAAAGATAAAIGTAAAQTPAELPPDQMSISMSLSGTCIPANTLVQDAVETDLTYYSMTPGNRPPAGVWLNGIPGVNPWQPSAWLMGHIAEFIADGTACVPSNQLLPQQSSTPPSTTGSSGQDATSTSSTADPPNSAVPPNTGGGALSTSSAPPTTGSDESGGGNGSSTTTPPNTTPTVVAPGAFSASLSQPYTENGVEVVNLSWTTPSGTQPMSYSVSVSEALATPYGGNSYNTTAGVTTGNSLQIQVTGSSEAIASFTAKVIASNSAGSATSNTVTY